MPTTNHPQRSSNVLCPASWKLESLFFVRSDETYAKSYHGHTYRVRRKRISTLCIIYPLSALGVSFRANAGRGRECVHGGRVLVQIFGKSGRSEACTLKRVVFFCSLLFQSQSPEGRQALGRDVPPPTFQCSPDNVITPLRLALARVFPLLFALKISVFAFHPRVSPSDNRCCRLSALEVACSTSILHSL